MKKLGTLLLLMLGLVGCGEDTKSGASQTEGGKPETSFNVNIGEEGKTIDPQLSTSSTSTNILSFIQDGLATYDENLKVVPSLAESWDVSEDGLVYTFKLRDGLKWSNGAPLTAKDFRYAWLRELNPETAAEYAYMLFPIVNGEEYNAGKVSADEVGIKVLDDKTLEVRLHTPVPFFPSLTAFTAYYPLNQEFYEKNKDEFALEPETMIYCGPYSLQEWVHNSEMTLVKNPNYYAANDTKIDKINVKFIADSGAALNAFENNELDIVGLTAEQYEKFKEDPRVRKQIKNAVWYVEYNIDHPVLSNTKIRQALTLAVDKEALVETVGKGTSTAAYSFTPANVGMKGINGGDFIEEMGAPHEKYNPEKAKKLLAEGLQELGLTELPELNLLVNLAGSNKKVAEVVQEDIRRNLGVNINIEAKEFKERLSKMNSGNFDMTTAGWGADYQDPMTYLDLFYTNAGNNHGKYSNPEYDKLVDMARKETDAAKRIGYMQEIERIIARDLPVAPLSNSTYIYLVNPKVKGLVFASFGAQYILRKTYIDETAK